MRDWHWLAQGWTSLIVKCLILLSVINATSHILLYSWSNWWSVWWVWSLTEWWMADLSATWSSIISHNQPSWIVRSWSSDIHWFLHWRPLALCVSNADCVLVPKWWRVTRHHGWRLCVWLKPLKFIYDGTVTVHWAGILWEGRSVRALNAHNSLHLIKSPFCCHSFTIDGLSKSHITMVWYAIFLLPLASTPWTTLFRILPKAVESLFFVDGCLIVDYLVDLIV